MKTISDQEYGWFKREIKAAKKLRLKAIELANDVLKFSEGDDLVDLHDQAFYFIKNYEGSIE